MLLINGTLDGRSYNNEIIDPKVLAKAFNLPTNGIYNLWNPNPQRDHFGQIRQPRSTGTGSLVNIMSKRGQFSLRYYTTFTESDQGRRKYLPESIQIYGQPDYSEETFDLFVFVCLSGLVGGVEGIAAKPNYVPYLHVYRPEEVAQLAEDRVNIAEKLMKQIIEMPTESLLIRGRGLGISGSVAAVRMELFNRLTKDPVTFDQAFNSDQNSDRGLILRAIDTAVIEVKAIRSVNTWVFGSETSRRDRELCVIGNASPEEVIFQYISDPVRRADLFSYIKQYLEPEKPVEVIEPVMKPTEFEPTGFAAKIVGEAFPKDGKIFVKKGDKDYLITDVVDNEEISVTLQKFFEEKINRDKFLFLTKN